MLTLGYVLAGCSFLVRGFSVFFSPVPDPKPFAPSLAQNLAILLSAPSVVACTMGFVLLHRERIEREVRLLAEIDPLTGLQNRRGFEAAFARELHGEGDAANWVSLAVVDVDHFKAINDRYGHDLGDKALREVARLAACELRADDLMARIGGDEFCVLLAQTAPERAGKVAERLRRAVSEHNWQSLGLPTGLTVTIGLASRRGDSRESGAEFFRRADRALLAAKERTRDSVLQAEDRPVVLGCRAEA